MRGTLPLGKVIDKNLRAIVSWSKKSHKDKYNVINHIMYTYAMMYRSSTRIRESEKTPGNGTSREASTREKAAGALKNGLLMEREISKTCKSAAGVLQEPKAMDPIRRLRLVPVVPNRRHGCRLLMPLSGTHQHSGAQNGKNSPRYLGKRSRSPGAQRQSAGQALLWGQSLKEMTAAFFRSQRVKIPHQLFAHTEL